jgi:hypothetical protein
VSVFVGPGPPRLVLREGHCVPPGSSFYEGEDDARCRVVKPDGERCRAPRIVRYGICAGHSGLGLAADPVAAEQRSKEVRARWKARRTLLGIPASGRANPRQLARLKALQRSEELAEALVDGPLDDPDLGSMQRQLAAARVVDATFPLAEATVEVELPATAEGVTALSWDQMKVLAARLLGPEEAGLVEGESLAIEAGEQ